MKKKLLLTLVFSFAVVFLFAQDKNLPNKTLLATFLEGLREGFYAVVQPCLYAMFPVTVSFFLKRSDNRVHGIKNALIYSLSIILIFTVFGGLLTILFGKYLYIVSSSPPFNIFIFALFMIFGISFLG